MGETTEKEREVKDIIFTIIAGNCVSDNATEDAVSKLYDFINQHYVPREQYEELKIRKYNLQKQNDELTQKLINAGVERAPIGKNISKG